MLSVAEPHLISLLDPELVEMGGDVVTASNTIV
jgi:hypothetical protein